MTDPSMSTDPTIQASIPDRFGQVFENPITRERAVMLTDPAVRPDRALVGQLRVGVGGRVAAPHTHPVATERFRVIGGQVGFQIGADRRVLGPGDQAEVPDLPQ